MCVYCVCSFAPDIWPLKWSNSIYCWRIHFRIASVFGNGPTQLPLNHIDLTHKRFRHPSSVERGQSKGVCCVCVVWKLPEHQTCTQSIYYVSTWFYAISSFSHIALFPIECVEMDQQFSTLNSMQCVCIEWLHSPENVRFKDIWATITIIDILLLSKK